jgi:YVTN family beta-propeller protein
VPIRVTFSPDGKYAFVPNREGGSLSVILVETHREIKRIPVGLWAGGTVFNATGSLCFVANNKTNDISVIDVKSLKVIDTIDVGLHPDGMAFCSVKE